MNTFKGWLLINFIFIASLQAQFEKTAVFTSLSGYRNTGFDNNLFTEGHIGIQLWSDKIFYPEIGIGFASSSLNDQSKVFLINDVETEQQIKTNIRAFLFSLGMNLRLTKRESYWITSFANLNFLPNVTFRSQLFEGTSVNTISLKEEILLREASNYFCLGIGIEGFINEKETWLGSLSIVYTTNNIYDAFNSAEFSDANLNINFPSRGGLGLRFLEVSI